MASLVARLDPAQLEEACDLAEVHPLCAEQTFVHSHVGRGNRGSTVEEGRAGWERHPFKKCAAAKKKFAHMLNLRGSIEVQTMA